MKTLILTPSLLKKLGRLPARPEILSYRGVEPNRFIEAPCIAIVGSRKISPYGKQVTEALAQDLARAGCVVVSGFAFGVDITAHLAAVNAGGKTIAVLASGLQNIYPASHQSYTGKIEESGCFISEYSDKHLPKKHEFLKRNGIIAALSDAVVITEATDRSGSLNTARQAKTMGIPVFAVPGPITSSLSEGTNQLLVDGVAQAVTSAADIFRKLDIKPSKPAKSMLLGATEQENLILEVLSEAARDQTSIQTIANLSAEAFSQAITMLEIADLVSQDQNGNWHLKIN